jgi:hypothetical protein
MLCKVSIGLSSINLCKPNLVNTKISLFFDILIKINNKLNNIIYILNNKLK